MLYEKTDNILYNCCSLAELVRITDKRGNVYFCDGFLFIDTDSYESDYLVFHHIYDVTNSAFHKDYGIRTGCIQDIEFSFKDINKINK